MHFQILFRNSGHRPRETLFRLVEDACNNNFFYLLKILFHHNPQRICFFRKSDFLFFIPHERKFQFSFGLG